MRGCNTAVTEHGEPVAHLRLRAALGVGDVVRRQPPCVTRRPQPLHAARVRTPGRREREPRPEPSGSIRTERARAPFRVVRVLMHDEATLTFPEPIAKVENAWLAYQRSGRLAPLGKAPEGRCWRAFPKFITALTNVTGTTADTTPSTLLIADSEGFERAEASVDFTDTFDRASIDMVTVDSLAPARCGGSRPRPIGTRPWAS